MVFNYYLTLSEPYMQISINKYLDIQYQAKYLSNTNLYNKFKNKI